MAASGEFSIYVKTLTGASAEVRTSSDETVGSLKSKIQDRLKLTLPIVRLVHDSKELGDDGQTLGDYRVGQEAIVVVVLESSKPCHFFFALDESGSMSGHRWNQLISSFKDFVVQRHSDAAKKREKLNDLVSVFFHQTHCRVAAYVDAAGNRRPFDSIPLADVTPDSLVDEFQSGGNNFDHVLRFLEPYLDKCTDYIPVLTFMTDGGDCGDEAPPCADFRQRAYDRMAAIKARLPELRLYVTVVYTDSACDIEGAKRLCLAGGSDIETFFTYLGDNHLEEYVAPAAETYAAPAAETYAAPAAKSLTSCHMLGGGSSSSSTRAYSSYALPPASSASASSMDSASSIDSASSMESARSKMAKQWEHTYQCNSSHRP